MAANKSLLMLPGDGIGPEVMGQVRRVSSTGFGPSAVPSAFDDRREGLVGGASLDKRGLPDAPRDHGGRACPTAPCCWAR